MFHIAFPILNLKETIKFYTKVLNATIGRSTSNWADFNWFENQITVQVAGNFRKKTPVLGKEGVPLSHFGIVLELSEWHKIKQQMLANNIPFLVQPRIVFEGEVGEQHSFFVEDPNGYSIEFKGFKSLNSVFQSK